MHIIVIEYINLNLFLNSEILSWEVRTTESGKKCKRVLLLSKKWLL